MSEFVLAASKNYYPDKSENVMQSIFSQYERVIVQSIITSFGLDFLIKDQHGGDVDTIHNVRQIGKDPNMTYKNKQNQRDYENRGEYNSTSYHSHPGYIQKNKEVSQQKKDGTLTDAYTGEKIAPNEKTNLDHVISAKEIHDDPGRVLSGLDGTKLANSDENLKPTGESINKSKKAYSMDEFINRLEKTQEQRQKRIDELNSKPNLSDSERKELKKLSQLQSADKEKMREIDKKARKEYEYKIAKEYYTSKKFATDVAVSAGKVGVKMGIRQALGLVFTEIWFSVKEEFVKYDVHPGWKMDMGDFFKAIGEGVKNGFASAKSKYKEILSNFASGTFSGIFSSITTTICNIFFTTAKNVVKIIRESFSSIVEAGKILLFNPDNLPFGERIRAAVKIIATGASVILGTLVSEAIGKTPVAAIPVIGDIVKTFCGTLCTGIVSCTLLYFLDRSSVINKIVNMLNKIPTLEDNVRYFQEQALLFERYAAELMKIDLEKFKQETSAYNRIASQINENTSDEELNFILRRSLKQLGIKMSWEKSHDSFDSFMSDKKSKMVFD